MIHALWGWSILAVMAGTWWPVTRFAYRQAEREARETARRRGRDYHADYPTEVGRGVMAAFLGFVGALLCGIAWPALLVAFLIGHAVSRAAGKPGPIEAWTEANR